MSLDVRDRICLLRVVCSFSFRDYIILELDHLFSAHQLSAKGSVTTESDLRRKVDIKETGGAGGTQIIEEDITMERKHSSVTTGENSVSNFQVSIVREKHPVSVQNGTLLISKNQKFCITIL